MKGLKSSFKVDLGMGVAAAAILQRIVDSLNRYHRGGVGLPCGFDNQKNSFVNRRVIGAEGRHVFQDQGGQASL